MFNFSTRKQRTILTFLVVLFRLKYYYYLLYQLTTLFFRVDYLGQTIIKVDSITSDLSELSVELHLLKRKSWLGLVLQKDDAFSVIKQRPLQSFSNQVVSISSDLKNLDIYAINLKLYSKNGTITEQQFMFIAGLPFTKIMVAIATMLLFFIVFIFIKQSKRQQQ